MSKTTNIRQRKNGLWEGRYRLNGKQCAVYGQTKAEAKAKLAARMTEVEQGICIERTDLTLEEWGWEWLKTFKEGKIRHSTMDNYESDFRMHVVPYIGHIKLKDLTTLHIQRTYTKAQQNGLSPKSIRNIHGLVHGMLAKAQSLDMVRKNVSEDCELPMLEKAEMHTLSDVELRRFLAIAKDDPFYLMYYVDFFTGLRESELIGLTWDCIDLRRGLSVCTVSLCALHPGLTRANDVHFAEKPQRAHDSSRAIRDGRIEASQREAEPAASARRFIMGQCVRHGFHS